MEGAAIFNQLVKNAHAISMTFHTRKTVCMLFNPYCPRKVECIAFPNFRVGTSKFEFVGQSHFLEAACWQL
jgi:hypothetical protein